MDNQGTVIGHIVDVVMILALGFLYVGALAAGTLLNYVRSLGSRVAEAAMGGSPDHPPQNEPAR